MNNYRYKQLAYQEWQSLYDKGELNEIQSAFFENRAPEMLFDIDTDPYETKNLANDPEHKATLLDLRNRLNTWVKGMPDLSFYPEHHLIGEAFNNPVAFGQKHKKEIEKYMEIADLGLLSFREAENSLTQALDSSDKGNLIRWPGADQQSACRRIPGYRKEIGPILGNDKRFVHFRKTKWSPADPKFDRVDEF